MKSTEQILAENKILKSKAEALKRENEKLEKEVAELNEKLKWYNEQLAYNKQKRFGKSSEKNVDGQLNLFNEAESESEPFTPEPEVEEVVVKKRRKKRQRKDLYGNLPVERVEHDIPEEDKVCTVCGEPMHKMSEEVVRRIEVIPAQFKIVEDVYPIYACRNCEKKNTEVPVIKAEKEPRLMKKSLVSPSLMAYIMTRKFVSGLPLYRQEQEFKQNGLLLSRQTTSNWIIAGANLLEPLYNHLHEELLKREVLHADETEVEVLQEPKRRYDLKSFMWLYRTSKSDKPIVLYDYQVGRSGIFAKEFLSGFTGYLHTDGWGGYNRLKDEVKLCGCWAHMRRKFDEALKILSNLPEDCPERIGLDYCNKLFKIEEDAKNMSDKERLELRQKKSLPIADAFFEWVKSEQNRLTVPQSLLGTALTYAVKQEEKLRRFLEDGRIELSNNRAERSIKPFVIGRKNWLFCNTPKGATSSAIIYSIIETAKENSLKPFDYLKWLFTSLMKKDLPVENLTPYAENLLNDLRITQPEV